MTVLFLHGWQSTPGGVKPTHLVQCGHAVLNPALPDDDFEAAVRVAQEEYQRHRPDVVVGSSRGGAVAMNIAVGDTPLVLLCPAWKRWGTATTVKPGTVILHSPHDETIPFAESQELLRNSGLDESALVVVGGDHRLADPESLATMARMVAEMEARGRRGPPRREAGVPRRFGIGVLLVITTMYAVLFAVLKALAAPPIVFGTIALFFTAVGLGQMLLFGGRHPRRASVIVGMVYFPCVFMVLVAYVTYSAGPPHFRMWSDLIAGIVCLSTVGGASMGYLGGLLISGVFLFLGKLAAIPEDTAEAKPASPSVRPGECPFQQKDDS